MEAYDYRARCEADIERLADTVDRELDIALIQALLGLPEQPERIGVLP